MSDPEHDAKNWLDGELKLVGIDAKMMGLLQAIDQTGSISQAAKSCRLSYKGAWQIIERANNAAPKVLIGTATGGSKGGGATLTESGRALLELFLDLQEQHRHFLALLNQNLLTKAETRLLLQRLAVKTSVRNQLFGTIARIDRGAVNAQVIVNLSGNLPVQIMPGLAVLDKLALKPGMEAVLLINPADIVLTTNAGDQKYSAANCLSGNVIRIQQNDIQSEVTALLSNGELLSCLVTEESLQALSLAVDTAVQLMFTANAPIVGLKPG